MLFYLAFSIGGEVGYELESRASKVPEIETSAENTSPESEIAFLPMLQAVFLLTKAWQSLFYVCESERELEISSRTQRSWKLK